MGEDEKNGGGGRTENSIGGGDFHGPVIMAGSIDGALFGSRRPKAALLRTGLPVAVLLGLVLAGGAYAVRNHLADTAARESRSAGNAPTGPISASPAPPSPSPSGSDRPSPEPSATPSPAPAPSTPAPGPSAPPPAPRPEGQGAAPLKNKVLRNRSTRMCVGTPVGAGAPSQGTPVQQVSCRAGDADQRFDLVPGAGGDYLVSPAKNPDLCLDPPELGIPANSQIGLFPCWDGKGDNQLWRLKWDTARTAFRLVNALSGDTDRPMCLDVPGLGERSEGLPLGVYPCNGSGEDDHWWTLES
ncbi:RICIN domain-containing protein [Streptomyces sp. NPDC046876]|uniref:RICIN domain-containing protein n=1 Tax=Streptomyces sp. NPDC046876 TaxID=3155616 RepID=UPI0033F934C8